MKPTEQELKAMFGQTPDSFSAAMERALNGEAPAHEQSKTPRRLNRTWSIVLIVALALALTTGAYAAAVRLGFIDLMKNGAFGYIPQSALDVLQATEEHSWEVGPLTVTFNEAIADGQLVFVACQARVTDGGKALLCDWDLVGRTPDVLKQKLGIEDEWLIYAAQNYEGPVYSVETWLEMDYELTDGEAMMVDPVYGSDGSILSAYMVDTIPERIGDTVEVAMRVRVNRMVISNVQMDREIIRSDREILETWEEVFPVEIPVTGVIETKTYTPAEHADLGWAVVERVDVERTPVGLYTYTKLHFTDEEFNVYQAYEIQVLCGPDDQYNTGLYQSGYLEDENYPEVVLMTFVSADEMPETLYLQYDDIEIEVR